MNLLRRPGPAALLFALGVVSTQRHRLARAPNGRPLEAERDRPAAAPNLQGRRKRSAPVHQGLARTLEAHGRARPVP